MTDIALIVEQYRLCKQQDQELMRRINRVSSEQIALIQRQHERFLEVERTVLSHPAIRLMIYDSSYTKEMLIAAGILLLLIICWQVQFV